MTHSRCLSWWTNATAAVLVVLALAATGGAIAGEKTDKYQGEMKDAWLDGKIETAYTLNRHLNPFSIDTEVENGIVTLEGTVESDIDRDLAGEIAANVEGITDVQNNLTVEGDGAQDSMAHEDSMADDAQQAGRGFLQTVDDATTTAAVKSRLVANSNTKALEIDVDTERDVVTLSGTVRSAEERDLAAELAKSTRNVTDVNNKLVVANQ